MDAPCTKRTGNAYRKGHGKHLGIASIVDLFCRARFRKRRNIDAAHIACHRKGMGNLGNLKKVGAHSRLLRTLAREHEHCH